MSFFKLSIAAVATGATASPVLDILSQTLQFPVLNTTVAVVGTAALGAGMSLFFGDPLESRKMLYGQVLAATVFGASVAVLVADGMNWDWAIKNMQMFSLVSAALMRWFLPSIIDRGKQIIKDFKLPSIKKPSGEDK